MADDDDLTVAKAIIAAGGGVPPRILGRPIEEVGVSFRPVTRAQYENVRNVVLDAEAKLPPGSGAGEMPPRVGSRVWDEAVFADNEVSVSYLGGVLASSWEPGGRDDRGVPITALVGRLSKYSLRAHFIFYSEWRRLLLGSSVNIGAKDEVGGAHMYMPNRVYYPAMGLAPDEDPASITTHTMHNLSREELIDDWASGPLELIRRWVPGATEAGIELLPTMSGAELFMWGMGMGKQDPRDMFNPALNIPVQSVGIAIPPGAEIVTLMHEPERPI